MLSLVLNLNPDPDTAEPERTRGGKVHDAARRAHLGLAWHVSFRVSVAGFSLGASSLGVLKPNIDYRP